MIKPLILISIPDTIDGYKAILSKLLMYRNKYQVPLGIEIYLSDLRESANKNRMLKRVVNKYNIPLAVYLPVLKENDLKDLVDVYKRQYRRRVLYLFTLMVPVMCFRQ